MPLVLLAYVDESYTKTHYWMAAVLCTDDTLAPLGAALDACVAQAAASYEGISPTAELHGYDLFHGTRDWAPLKTLARARIGAYAAAAKAIGDSGAEIIIRGVDIVRLQRRYNWPDHPHAVVLAHILERIDDVARQRDQYALVIADEIDQAIEYRRHLWHFQRYATGGYRSRQLRRIVDTIHFAPSSASRLVQAADLVAYLHQRREASIDPPQAVRANDQIWGHVEGRLLHRHCWLP